jgi:hypothetical protein
MTLQWVPDTESRNASIARLGTRGTLAKDVPYIVLGATTEDEIHLGANSYISSTVPFWTYPNQPTVRLPAMSYDVEYLGDQAWRVTVHYERQGADSDNQTQPLRRSRAFDTTGQTEHLTRALDQLASGPSDAQKKFDVFGPTTITDNDELYAINFDGEQVHGVDVVAPALNWTEQYDVPGAYVTWDYVKKVSALTGTINVAPFRSFDAGEVLFLGAAGSQDWDSENGDGPIRLQFKFQARPNAGSGKTLPPITVGNVTGVEKRGHDFLWVRYYKKIFNGQLFPRAESVYVSRVYRDGDLSLLGIGTT